MQPGYLFQDPWLSVPAFRSGSTFMKQDFTKINHRPPAEQEV